MKILKISCVAALMLLLSAAAFALEKQLNLAEEYDLAEKVALARANHKASLESLIEFYTTLGDATKLAMAQEELDALDAIAQPQYVLLTRKLKPGSAEENILEANRLYQDGFNYKNQADLFTKKNKLDTAIKRFTELLDNYPTSDKVDDACYMLGEIYEGYYYKDYDRGAQYFEKCYEVNPNTKHPARFKAAEIYYKKLKLWNKAIDVYQETWEHSPVLKNRQIAAQRIEELKAYNVFPTKKSEGEAK